MILSHGEAITIGLEQNNKNNIGYSHYNDNNDNNNDTDDNNNNNHNSSNNINNKINNNNSSNNNNVIKLIFRTCQPRCNTNSLITSHLRRVPPRIRYLRCLL